MENKKIKNIMNRNWDTMSAILDKEMPVTKKKRGLWVWFLLIGIMVISSAYLVIMNVHTEKMMDNTLQPTETKGNHVIANKYQSSNHILVENKPSKIKLSSTRNTDTPSRNNQIKNNQVSKSLNIESFTQNVMVHDTKKEGKSISLIDNENITQETDGSKADQNISNVSYNNLNNNILEESKTHDSQILNLLPTIDKNGIFYNKEILKISLPNLLSTSYRLGVVASVASIDLGSVSSYFAGVQGEKKIGTSFSLYTNLGWRQHKGTNINIQHEGITLDKSEMFNNTTITAASSSQNADQELTQLIIRDITKTINYLELTTGVRYQLFNSLSLHGGLNLGYLLSESYEIDEETRSNYIISAKEYDLSNIVTNAEQSNLHQNWTAHIHAGIETRLNSSLYIYSNLHHLLNNYTTTYSSNKINGNKNWLELGVKYNFIK
jgi:hypothetical protein